MAPQDSDHQDQASALAASGVGGVLRATRLRIGEDLREVAKTLHIRFIYLQAIEDGRYQDLPGAAYALGFIRSYADYLGLDSKEVIRRFKSEATPEETESADLVFPVPIPESSVPGGAFVFIGLIIAVLAYGGWYASTAKNGFFADLISPLPDRLSALLPGDKTTKSDAKPAQETVTAPSGPVVTSETAPATVVEVPGTPTSAEPAPQVVEQVAPKQAVAEPAVTEQASKAAPETVTTAVDQPAGQDTGASVQEPEVARPAVETVTEPGNGAAITKSVTENVTEKSVPETVPKNSPEPVAESSPKSPAKTAPQTTVPKPPPPAGETVPARHVDTVVAAKDDHAAATKDVTATTQQATVATTTEAAPERKPETVSKPSLAAAGVTKAVAAKAEAAKGRVYGVKDGNFRIEVKAIKNSWIQVRDDVAKTLILTRLLRRGDSYRVPDRKGLKLLTGNAGGIEILVDGRAVPSIGGIGVVRRDVALDPELLKQGQAVN